MIRLVLALALLLPLPAYTARIVSLAPVATEFLFALGLSDQIVGVTTYCDRPQGAKQIPKIGGFADPQLEVIIKLKPSLVIATPFGQAKNVVDALKARGLKTISLPAETLEQGRSLLRAIGRETGRVKQAEQLQGELDRQFGTYQNKGKNSPKVLFLISSSPLIAAAPSTFPGEILTHIGAENTVTAVSPMWPILSLESLMKQPPDIIVVSNGVESLEATKRDLKQLVAKYAGIRFFASKGVLLQRPGPYLNEEIEELIEGLSPPRPAPAGRGPG